MKDPEFIELKNRFLIGVGISLLVGIPLFLFFIIRLDVLTPNIIKKIENKESFFLFIEEKKCNNCKEMKKVLSQEDTSYLIISIEESNLYNKILNKLNTKEEDYPPPSIMYIENGILKASLPSIQSENELLEFMENYKE